MAGKDARQEAEEIERRIDELNPDVTPAQDTRDLRELAQLVDQREALKESIEAAVAQARRNGKSWGKIAIALQISRQDARQRYGNGGGTRLE